MTSIVDSIRGALSSVLGDQNKHPLHVGEVMNLWTYMTMLGEGNRYAEMGLNMTTDSELKEAIQKVWDECSDMLDRLKKLLQEEGVPLPPLDQPKPRSEPDQVPTGVKMSDSELANGLVIKVVASITFCAASLAQSLRPDVGVLWYEFLNSRIRFSAYFMPIMWKRGWLKVPPYYMPPGAPSPS